MVHIENGGAYVFGGVTAVPAREAEAPGSPYRNANGHPLTADTRTEAARRTIAHGILWAHDTSGHDDKRCACETRALKLRFDRLASHDITYVSVIQTLRAADRDYARFPIPYALCNCHNSLCAVGGTINADDHAFGLSAAKRFGGVFVPPHVAVIHQYMREAAAGGGLMILGSDSHTRYGALGTMGIGEGGGELVKQLLGRTYDLEYPEIVGVCLTGAPEPGVGPQDIALALIGAVFASGFVKNKVLEFFGEGIARLSVDYRNAIDVMTTETACLSSIWVTDEKVAEYYHTHGRADAYKALKPGEAAYYDGLITIDLSTVKPMIALPFHPSHVYEIDTLKENAADIAARVEKEWAAEGNAFSLADKLTDGGLRFDQGIIAGCAGGLYENLCAAAAILEGGAGGLDNTWGSALSLSVYPASQPVYLALAENGILSRLTRAGAVVKTAFCGPCFGAGDIPAHNGLSARHATRNFPNREGGKPGAGQRAAVALMDARSIAATAKNGGLLTAASEVDTEMTVPRFFFDKSLYEKRVYDGYGKPDASAPLVLGPGIRDWPALAPLADHWLLSVAAFITDPVTTTDELIPSGETSSYRSNPLALAEFTLSRKDPGYVARAKAAALPEQLRLAGDNPTPGDVALADVFAAVRRALNGHTGLDGVMDIDLMRTGLGSAIFAVKPGDGSAREQAASCQRVLGGLANFAREYATKRYRSNLINWGILPFILPEEPLFRMGDYVFIPEIRRVVERRDDTITAYWVRRTDDALVPFTLRLPGLTADEAAILLEGGLINYYGSERK